MGERITRSSGLTIGLDIGDRNTVGCVLSGDGEVLKTFRMATTPAAVRRTMEGFEASRVVLEVGMHSPWMSRVVESAGHELIAENDSKTDDVDAELLARLGRVDPKLLKPIVHRGEQAQRDRVLLLARDGLVRARTQLINQVRGFAKSLGHRMPTSSTEAFPRRVREQFSEDVSVGAYVGLRPCSRQSGEQRPQLRITKAGDALLRRYLVTAAQYILGPFGPDTELRRFGLKLAERGGRAAKKRAVVAVARKLSVLMHRLWITGGEHEPLGYGKPAQKAA